VDNYAAIRTCYAFTHCY